MLVLESQCHAQILCGRAWDPDDHTQVHEARLGSIKTRLETSMLGLSLASMDQGLSMEDPHLAFVDPSRISIDSSLSFGDLSTGTRSLDSASLDLRA